MIQRKTKKNWWKKIGIVIWGRVTKFEVSNNFFAFFNTHTTHTDGMRIEGGSGFLDSYLMGK